MIGFAMCGSFCTHKRALETLRELIGEGYEVLPVFSECVWDTDTRFGNAADRIREVSTLCGREPIHTVVGAEPLGPAIRLDALVICPCTGNTLAKIAGGITDGTVPMAAKAHLRSDRPLVIALASNDALSANLGNIATLLSRKNVYFVPMAEDDPVNKPHSLVADFGLVPETLRDALRGKQYPRVFR